MTVRIEILQVADCPHTEVARDRILDASEGIAVSVTVTKVRDDADAARLGMHGSPTVLIDGIDPFNDPAEPTSCGCRVRPGSDPVPTVDDFRIALRP